jgi:hypothetical protein
LNPNALLPNLRWLAIHSAQMGQDWYEKSLELDQELEALGMDLSEEAVYLIYSENPDQILEGLGQCLIARSVIGSKKEVTRPLSLLDWKASPVWRERLFETSLGDMLERAADLHHKALKGAQRSARGFILCVRRELRPDLGLSCEVIFHE